MKKLLIVLLLMPVICRGQYPEQKILPTAPVFKIIPKQDTIAVMLLVCDTAFIEGLTTALISHGFGNNQRSIYEIPNRTPAVWWQFGYVVSEIIWHRQWENDLYMRPIYLDANKKPLPKSIVVWMAKTIQ